MTNSPHIRRVFLDPHLHDAAKELSDAQGVSVSEVVREAMAGFTTGEYPQQGRVLRPVKIWIDPEEYAAFAAKARESGVTIRRALEIALENTL